MLIIISSGNDEQYLRSLEDDWMNSEGSPQSGQHVVTIASESTSGDGGGIGSSEDMVTGLGLGLVLGLLMVPFVRA